MTKRTTSPPPPTYEQVLANWEACSSAFAQQFARRAELELQLEAARARHREELASAERSRAGLALSVFRLQRQVTEQEAALARARALLARAIECIPDALEQPAGANLRALREDARALLAEPRS